MPAKNSMLDGLGDKAFDEEVGKLIAAGTIVPRQVAKTKRQCTVEEWAAKKLYSRKWVRQKLNRQKKEEPFGGLDEAEFDRRAERLIEKGAVAARQLLKRKKDRTVEEHAAHKLWQRLYRTQDVKGARRRKRQSRLKQIERLKKLPAFAGMTEEAFDREVKRLLASGSIKPRETNIPKAQCTPRQWAAKLLRARTYARENPGQHIETAKRHRAKHRPKILARQRSRAKEYYVENREAIKQKSAEYYRANPEKARDRERLRRATDPLHRLRHALRNRWLKALRLARAGKYRSALDVGLPTTRELLKHLERKFEPGMSWENHGKDWHIDHIMPLTGKGVDLNNPAHQYAVCHYTNLRPAWGSENMAKNNHVTPAARARFNRLVRKYLANSASPSR